MNSPSIPELAMELFPVSDFFAFAAADENEAPAPNSTNSDSSNSAPTLSLGSLSQPAFGVRAKTAESLAAFETLMGGPAQGVLGFADDANPAHSLARVLQDAPTFAAMEKPVNWAIPLAWNGISLADVASGAYDSTFAAMATAIAENQTEDVNPLLYVRLGWEATNYYPWKVHSGPDNALDESLVEDYIDAFQHVATIFRSVDDRFQIEWNQNYSKQDANGVYYDLAELYPGDEFVDVVGVDAYNVARFSGQDDPVSAWDYKLNAPYGLAWFSDFAAQHGKPLAMTEWGIDSDDFGSYVDDLAEFVRTNNVIYTNYWNADAKTNGNDTLTDGSKPATAAAIADAFGPDGNSALIPGEQSGLIVEAGVAADGSPLVGTSSASIWAVKGDPDAGDTATFDTAGWAMLDPTHMAKNGVYGVAVLDTETGVIKYTLDNSRAVTNALADEDSVTDAFSVTVVDTNGASTTGQAGFSITGTNDRDGFFSGVAGLSAGADSFVFDTPPDAPANVEAIFDFDPAEDRFLLDHAAFDNAPLGRLDASAFTGSQVAGGSDRRVAFDEVSDDLSMPGFGGADGFDLASFARQLAASSDDFMIG
jgi:VCBS repeat-containing protein